MSKIRINDLARELEVKSKEILDVLTTVGVTEKKTHSSSLEDHEAELVRKHLRGRSEGAPSAGKASRAVHGDDGIKTKIDLSNISRPGDVLRAITQQKGVADHPAARPVVKPPVEKPAVEAKAVPPKPAGDTPAPPAPRMVTPASVAAGYRPPTVVVIPPKIPVAPPAATTPAGTASTAPPAIAVPPRVTTPAGLAGSAPPAAQPSGNVMQMGAAPPRSAAPIAPPPRMIMPQTGPRPVYKAPLAAPGAPAPGAASRPAPGRAPDRCTHPPRRSISAAPGSTAFAAAAGGQRRNRGRTAPQRG